MKLKVSYHHQGRGEGGREGGGREGGREVSGGSLELRLSMLNFVS